MALQSSGPISLANIQTEFGGSNPISLSEYYGVAGGIPGSGTISIGNFYGAANVFSFTISSNQSNANLRTLAVNAGWNQSALVEATINSGVVISSTSTSAALTINGTFPSGVTLVNNGVIVGRGGNGGKGGSMTSGAGWVVTTTVGVAGGLALSVSTAVSIHNNGTIAGGGGGGGGGGLSLRNVAPYDYNTDWLRVVSGGGGGGGRSSLASNTSGGGGGTISYTYLNNTIFGNAGGTGTYNTAGGGGAGKDDAGWNLTSGSGGSGGNWGAGGGTGAKGTSTNASWAIAGATGGSGGACTSGNGNISWITTGTRLGALG